MSQLVCSEQFQNLNLMSDDVSIEGPYLTKCGWKINSLSLLTAIALLRLYEGQQLVHAMITTLMTTTMYR